MKNSKEIFIRGAHYISDYKVQLVFNDNTIQTIDFGKFLSEHTHSVFKKYKRKENFKKFKIDQGNIVWGKNWDLIFPLEQLYYGKIN